LLKESDHIDKLFSDYLCDYEEKAPAYLWNNIQSEMQNHKRIKRNSRLQAIAAGIALLLTFGLGYLSSDIAKKNEYQARQLKINYGDYSEKQKILIENKHDYVNNKNIIIKKRSTINNTIDKKNKISDIQYIESKSLLYKLFDLSKEKFSPISFQKDKESSLALNKKKHDGKKSNQLLIDTLLFESGNLPEGGFLLSKKDETLSRWSFGTKFSPVYSLAEANDELAISQNQGIKASINSNKPNTQAIEKSALAFSGGLNVNYRIARRWSIESGLFYSQSRTIADDLVGSSMRGLNEGMVVYTPQGIKQVMTESNSPAMIGSQIIGSSRDETYYSLNMDYVSNAEYLELPFLVRYKIVDRMIGFDILSGISTNFLIGNRSSIVQDDISLWTGQTQEISPLLYNATIGFGINYNFYRSLSFNLEPTFKYSLISSESTSVMKYPYSFAVFAGFSYRFK